MTSQLISRSLFECDGPTLFSDAETCEMPRATMRLLVCSAAIGHCNVLILLQRPTEAHQQYCFKRRAIASMLYTEYPELELRVPNDPQFDDWERVVPIARVLVSPYSLFK